MATSLDQLQEMQGLYGPFTMAERVVQKIWLRQDFASSGLHLLDGRRLEIRAAGAWNLLGGPDFKGARLLIDGQPVTGDVEVHFHAADWRAHQHAFDPAYDQVALHVVLFPPGVGERPTQRRDGSAIPTVVLLPWLHRGLEEYASDEALEKITARDAAERVAELALLPKPELLHLLRHHAAGRWRLKVRFAGVRIDRLGWREAAHHAALEILGQRHNRVPMLAIAAECPLGTWPGLLATDELFERHRAQWRLQGVRPANHPRTRLRQYYRWVAARPDWPVHLRTALADGAGRPDAGAGTASARRQVRLAVLRQRLADQTGAGALGGSRLDTLICDGFLPLVAARTDEDLFGLWFHWFSGDVPDEVRWALRRLGVSGPGAEPFCHGWAQGFLGWFWERQAHASC